MNVKIMERFCKDASRIFFNEFGLTSHQINSFDPPFDRLPPLDMNVETVERLYKVLAQRPITLVLMMINSCSYSTNDLEFN